MRSFSLWYVPTWMRLAAGFLLFSKCFCRCCSCTFSAKPDPRMPYVHKIHKGTMEILQNNKKNVVLTLESFIMMNYFEETNGISYYTIMCACASLTAGRAKKEIPRRANPADNNRPVHVCGVLSPYPIVVRVI